MAEHDIRTTLKEHGLRYSRPREMILEFLFEKPQHLSAEGLYFGLKERGEALSLSTVYLNLAVLRRVGLVREFSGVNGEALYDSNVSRHHHLLCKVCGAISDLPETDIQGVSPGRFFKLQAEGATRWLVDEPSLEFSGLCPDCQ